MKSPPTVTDDCDDIFGPPRTYATGYCPPKNRPSMISAKYRQKEERRKVLKISINKLKKIEDPEASLCRSVLINNTMKRLQKEARDEKIQKQQLNYPRCYDNDNFLNIKSEFIKNELKHTTHFEEAQENFCAPESKIMDSLGADFVIENDFEGKIDEISALNSDSAKNMEVLNGLVEENLNSLGVNATNNVTHVDPTNDSDRFLCRKRSFDDMEDCDVQDVLSQFYMPPTPRMLTCIDDDEDVNVVDDEPLPKRVKIDEIVVNHCVSRLTSGHDSISTSIAQFESSNLVHSYGQNQDSSRMCESMEVSTLTDKKTDDFRVNNFINNNITESNSRVRYMSSTQNIETDTNSYSCGHASMFNELQSNVFHSLIASLET
ncbi:uncharacterized protein LOC116168299 [Photinus pyralis]|uniref:SERTA domain-containing protein n=2 Tax=Photinus pyralis TaxID=7054 RepID=A0A1Y1KUP7_PHOPY|nr:uncharacterized protein LOC116168299 [Photinus pyralis]XP_031339894.1 uncharacterized protein LOC116168299 [Photinus pyralis]XP_031339895.1 uncharacterized protein LOC116168299 [Photinus pyralis]XP_031339896.1 uncharacterized protein LOC116168299 [Photinus pyralis]XP_031339897.1 uncharacterized protein LOC116168299 [Photinus pyralis]